MSDTPAGPKVSLSSIFYGRVERAPRAVKQAVDILPIFLGYAAARVLIIAYFHRSRTKVAVFGELVDRNVINHAGRIGQGTREIARVMLVALTMDDPPFELELRRLIDIELG